MIKIIGNLTFRVLFLVWSIELITFFCSFEYTCFLFQNSSKKIQGKCRERWIFLNLPFAFCQLLLDCRLCFFCCWFVCCRFRCYLNTIHNFYSICWPNAYLLLSLCHYGEFLSAQLCWIFLLSDLRLQRLKLYQKTGFISYGLYVTKVRPCSSFLSVNQELYQKSLHQSWNLTLLLVSCGFIICIW